MARAGSESARAGSKTSTAAAVVVAAISVSLGTELGFVDDVSVPWRAVSEEKVRSRWRSIAAWAGVVALTTGSGMAWNVSGAGADSAAAAPCNARHAEDLFGRGSLVPVGVPSASVSGRSAAGAVDLHTGSGAAAGRFSEASFPGMPAPAANDKFGAAVSFALREVGSCSALVVGAPGADGGRGTVVVAYGSSSGLDTSHAVRLVGPSVGSGFGVAVAGDGPDVWVGAPYVSVDGIPGAGAVYHYTIQSDHSVTLVETITENTSAVPGSAAPEDHFGRVLSASGTTLAVGVPLRDVNGHVNAGAVTLLTRSGGMYGSPNTPLRAVTFTQDSAGVPGVTETNDYFGSAISFAFRPALPVGEGPDSYLLAVGVPDEDIGSVKDAGTIDVLGIDAPTLRPYLAVGAMQGSGGLPGANEAGDHFGASVAVGSYLGNDLGAGDVASDDVAVGVPGEDLGSIKDAGDVLIVKIYKDFQHTPRLTYVAPALRQGGGGSGDVGGAAQAGDQFGAGVGAFNVSVPGGPSNITSRPVVSIPGDDFGAIDAGEVVLVGKHAGVGTPNYADVTLRDSAGPATGERYGVTGTTSSAPGYQYCC